MAKKKRKSFRRYSNLRKTKDNKSKKRKKTRKKKRIRRTMKGGSSADSAAPVASSAGSTAPVASSAGSAAPSIDGALGISGWPSLFIIINKGEDRMDYVDMATDEIGDLRQPSARHITTLTQLHGLGMIEHLDILSNNLFTFYPFKVNLNSGDIGRILASLCTNSIYPESEVTTWLSGALDKLKQGTRGAVIRVGMAVDRSSFGHNIIDGIIEMFSYLINLFKVIFEDGNYYIIYLDYFLYKRYFKILKLENNKTEILPIDAILLDRFIDFIKFNFPVDYEKLQTGITMICGGGIDIIRGNSIEIKCKRENHIVTVSLILTLRSREVITVKLAELNASREI